ncbi:MAG: class I SAM-dependent methyltransferase [Planctomycetota bacterium]|nr:class I SAM-dependent methyltransferase [Planctomycetota bacterium]
MNHSHHSSSHLSRVLEPEVMDTVEDAHDYDSMDHREVNELFVTHLLKQIQNRDQLRNIHVLPILDVGTGTAQIPIELCQRFESSHISAIDLAEQMIAKAQNNVTQADLQSRISLQTIDAKSMPYEDHMFPVVMSNSIVHHIPCPEMVLSEMVRVTQPGGLIFVRDLLRPEKIQHLRDLVDRYAGEANAHQQLLFHQSLHASLTMDEMRSLIQKIGIPPETVEQTSDRHWTWTCLL